MDNNVILRTMRHILKANNAQICHIFDLGGLPCDPEDCFDMMRDEEDPDFLECSNNGLDGFLAGLVLFKRGPREDQADAAPVRAERLTNNVILKRLRVAFSLKDIDVMEILESVGFKLSKHELSALMRAYGHKNYTLCGDQVLRNFLRGLALRERGEAETPE